MRNILPFENLSFENMITTKTRMLLISKVVLKLKIFKSQKLKFVANPLDIPLNKYS